MIEMGAAHIRRRKKSIWAEERDRTGSKKATGEESDLTCVYARSAVPKYSREDESRAKKKALLIKTL